MASNDCWFRAFLCALNSLDEIKSNNRNIVNALKSPELYLKMYEAMTSVLKIPQGIQGDPCDALHYYIEKKDELMTCVTRIISCSRCIAINSKTSEKHCILQDSELDFSLVPSQKCKKCNAPVYSKVELNGGKIAVISASKYYQDKIASISGYIYVIKAVSVFEGADLSGHWYTYTRNLSKWFKHDPTMVEVLSLNLSSTSHILLFYECVGRVLKHN